MMKSCSLVLFWFCSSLPLYFMKYDRIFHYPFQVLQASEQLSDATISSQFKYNYQAISSSG